MADEQGLSEALVAFIREHISSVGELEVLLLLRQSAGRSWSAAEVSRELRSTEGSAQNHLSDLEAHGFLRCDARGQLRRYEYAPRESALEASVAELAAAYDQRRHTLIGVVFSSSPSKP